MLLLDTCTLLWLASDPTLLSDGARRAIANPSQRLFVSAITAFEIGVKHRRRALTLPMPPERWYEEALGHHGITEIPIDGRIAMRSTALPPLHNDPSDRIIVATAQRDGLVVVTPDALIKAYPKTRVLW